MKQTDFTDHQSFLSAMIKYGIIWTLAFWQKKKKAKKKNQRYKLVVVEMMILLI